jgi:hypothetical protein
MKTKTLKISLETAKKWYNGNNEELKNLALQIFSKDELREIVCVKSWKEFCEKYNKIENEYFIGVESHIVKFNRDNRHIDTDKNILATKEDAESFLALMQLKRLRDQWWESLKWKPDYTNNGIRKYAIVQVSNNIIIEHHYLFSHFLAFPTKEVAKNFLNCFKDLIEKAKELI